MVEWAEADVIVVQSLHAISVEANEIRCPHIRRTPHTYPVAKDMGWRRIEGQEVALESLSAHHVQARLIVAGEIVATKVKVTKTPYVWSGGGKARNRILKGDPSTGQVVSP